MTVEGNIVRRGTPEHERLVKSLRRGRKPASGKPGADLADDALVILERAGLSGFEREVRFHPTRRWRFGR